jgi:hypothetical protein
MKTNEQPVPQVTGVLREVSEWVCPMCGFIQMAHPSAAEVFCLKCHRTYSHNYIRSSRRD